MEGVFLAQTLGSKLLRIEACVISITAGSALAVEIRH